MITKRKHKRKTLYTDDEIEQYCQSVEKLLINIKDKSTAKKTKKEKEIKEEYLSSDDDSWELSMN